MSKIWEPLQPGDFVDIVAPASASTAEELAGAIRYISSLGLTPRVPKDLLKHKSSFFAAPEKIAFEHLRSALVSKERNAVWCLRGGYGSARLLPYLEKMKTPKKMKLFIGLSDISVLLNFFVENWGWIPVHGPILARMGRGKNPKAEKTAMKNLIFLGEGGRKFNRLRPLNQPARQKRSLTGSVIGGNLAMLTSTLGSPWELNAKGKIVFIEDIDERGYKVDRLLLSLEQAGVFHKAKGVVIGDFIGGLEPNGSNRVKEAIHHFSERMSLPVFGGLRSGHGTLQLPILFGFKYLKISLNK